MSRDAENPSGMRQCAVKAFLQEFVLALQNVRWRTHYGEGWIASMIVYGLHWVRVKEPRMTCPPLNGVSLNHAVALALQYIQCIQYILFSAESSFHVQHRSFIHPVSDIEVVCI